jgi:hypothetical protein
MNLVIKKVFFLVGLTLCVISNLHSQVVTSTRNGLWTDAATWDGGLVPTSANASEIIVNHDVIVPKSSAISILNTVVNGTLTIEPRANVTLEADALTQKFDLQVFGTLVLLDSVTLNGTSVTNTSFESGSRYIHRQGPLGFIPYATWDRNSTFEIAGFRANGYINIAHSDSWKQIFGNVVYNCPQQTTPFVDLNGYLRNIAGSFTVINSNNKPLRLSTNQNSVISIGEDLIVEGPSELWFSLNAANAVVNITGDFLYRSTSTGISYLSTKGNITVNVQGHMEMNSPGRIHMASINTDSIGPRQVNLNLSKDFLITAGLLVAPPASGKGTILFKGTEVQQVVSSPTGSTFQGNLDFIVESGSTVRLGNSVLSNQSGSLLVKGTLRVGSSHPGGAIQLGNLGNLHIQNQRIFENGSTVEYNGVAAQWIGNGHPSTPGVNLICSNSAGVSLLNEIVVEDFSLLGNFNSQTFPITILGDVTIPETVDFNSRRINLTGGKNQNINAPGVTIANLIINKTANAEVTLLNPLMVTESLVIESPNTFFYSNGYLTLPSTTDAGSGTASVGPLPAGSSILGAVTVQRYMSGEGRIYRYISSPIQNSSVASLMDDFPITGTFADPSTGPGISSKNSSFYFYDESRGSLQAGWLPYPPAGLASSNPLLVGKGYAAFIRNGSTATTWDVTGILNQGTISLPVNYTANNAPSNGWNLVGNPYACAIQWDEAGVDRWTRTNISAVIAIRDNGSEGGTFKYWDMDQDYSEIPGGQIASGQSFWVRATAPNPELIIREGTKTMDGAIFFRAPRKQIPSFALYLSKGSLTDVAYFKIRATAKSSLDDWDGLKLDNDNFDVSFISEDDQSLAIHARDKMPCDEIVEIGTKDLTPGLYTFDLATKHQFNNYEYTLIDNFLGTEPTLLPGTPVKFQVTSEKDSYAFDRFTLRLKDRIPSQDIYAVSPKIACGDSVVEIILKHAQAGIAYSAWNENGDLLSVDTAAVQGDFIINIPADSLSPGHQTIQFKAHSACHVTPLPRFVTLVKDTSPEVSATSTTACAGNSATLIAISDRSDAIFSWFASVDSPDTLATARVFETPPLKKAANYYVVASVPSGCSSERFPIDAQVVIYDSAKISIAGDTFSSNYIHTRWYFNGQKLVDSASQLKATLPGIYTIEVDTLGCVSRDSVEYFITKSEEVLEATAFYPNPVESYLFIHNPKSIKHVAIFNSLGVLILQQDSEQLKNSSAPGIDVSELADGIYEAIITDGIGERVVRFVKR